MTKKGPSPSWDKARSSSNHPILLLSDGHDGGEMKGLMSKKWKRGHLDMSRKLRRKAKKGDVIEID